MTQKLYARIRKCGGTSANVLEHGHHTLTLEIIRDEIEENHLDNSLAVGMKLYSLITD